MVKYDSILNSSWNLVTFIHEFTIHFSFHTQFFVELLKYPVHKNEIIFVPLQNVILSEVGFEPTPSYEDQNSHAPTICREGEPWVWRLRPLGHPDLCVIFSFQTPTID